MNTFDILVPFAGGLGMFIYGMHIMAQGLENAAGDRMKSLLEMLTKNKLMGVLLGAGITAIIQSSSATTVMVVGFVNAGIMNLAQGMGIIMGANIGTTVTGWLVSAVEWAEFLSPAKLAPIAVILGVVMMLTGKRRSSKEIANIIIGFGLLFIGITAMSSAVEPLKDSEGFTGLFATLGQSPLLGILAGALVTAIIQSSSASVGILQSLAGAGLVPFGAAVYIIMGQNIGTCVTAILSSIGAKKTAKTAALMHLLFNITGTLIFSIVSVCYFKLINPLAGIGSISQTQISMIHTFFNIGTTILLFPVSDYIIRLAKKIGNVKEDEADRSKVLLDPRILETPSIALKSSASEISRMGEIVCETLEISRNILYTKRDEDIRQIREDEDVVDRLCAGITGYLMQLGSLSIGKREHQKVARYLQVLSDMERVSDYCENISEFAETMIEKKLNFSNFARENLDIVMTEAIDCFRIALESFVTAEPQEARSKALTVIEKETKIDNLEISMRAQHMSRLSSSQCSPDEGILFLDMLVTLERISDHARNIVEEVLEEVSA